MQKDKTIRCILLAAILLLAMPCLAQQTGPFIKRHDRDNDGKLSRAEFPDRIKQLHGQMDADKDGLVTANEVRAFRQARAGQKRRDRPGPLAPNHADIKYGPHERNVIDLWLAKSDTPTPSGQTK